MISIVHVGSIFELFTYTKNDKQTNAVNLYSEIGTRRSVVIKSKSLFRIETWDFSHEPRAHLIVMSVCFLYMSGIQ